jgi:hypothetical protein
MLWDVRTVQQGNSVTLPRVAAWTVGRHFLTAVAKYAARRQEDAPSATGGTIWTSQRLSLTVALVPTVMAS